MVVAFRETPALNHHYVTIRLKPHTDFVPSVRFAAFSWRKHIDNFSIANHARESAKPHNVTHSHCLNHITPKGLQRKDAETPSRKALFEFPSLRPCVFALTNPLPLNGD